MTTASSTRLARTRSAGFGQALARLARAGATAPDPGFADLLNYHRLVADGVLVLKDERGELTGPLLAGWWYRGPDFESQTFDELARLSNAINRALRRLDIGWMLHIEAIVREESAYVGGAFESAIDRVLDDERHQSAAHYVTQYALFVTQAPGRFDHGRRKDLRRALLGTSEDGVLDDLGGRIARFERVLGEVEQSLGRELQITRMRRHGDDDGLLQALQLVINGSWKRCRVPDVPQTVDQLLARDLVWSPHAMQHGGSCAAVVSLFKYPSHTIPGLLGALTSLGIPLRWSTRFIVLDQRVAHRKLAHLRRTWMQKVVPLLSKLTGMPGSLDRDALDRTNEVEEEIKNLNSGEVAYGHYTAVVVTRGSTQREADERARQVVKELERCQFEARIETFNKLEALLGSFPGHGRQNVRKPLMHTLHLADLMPIAREWGGAPACPCPFYPNSSPPLMQVRTWSGGSFFLNLHVGDLGHTVVLGPTGSGKSTLLAAMCSQFMKYPRSRVIVLDNGASMLGLTLARGDGAFYPLGAENGLQLCPLADIDDEHDRAWAAEWLEMLCEEHGVSLSAEQCNQLYQGIVDLAELSPSAKDRTLTDALIHLSGTGIESILRYYTSGVGGRVLNGSSNAFAYHRFTTFELEQLMALGPKIANPALAFIFRQIEKRLDGRPTLVVIDEAWLSLSHPRFAERIRKWLKTWRKKNCAVVLATQSLSDVVDSPIANAVFESCATKILLPNHQASDEMKQLYIDKLLLSEVQVQLLTRVEKKRWYLYAADGRSRLFTLDLGPVQKAFWGASGQEDLSAMWSLFREHGGAWPAEWLRSRGLAQAAESYLGYASQEPGVEGESV